MTEPTKRYPYSEKPGKIRAFREYCQRIACGEAYWFYKFRYRSSTPQNALRQLYQWWDRVRQPGQSASLAHVLNKSNCRKCAVH